MRAWRRKHGWGPPKSHSERAVPLAHLASIAVRHAMEHSPYREHDDLIFHGSRRDVPYDHKLVRMESGLGAERLVRASRRPGQMKW